MAFEINLHNYKAVIWDWNGTLLDDVDYSVRCINKLLAKRNLTAINSDTYKSVFTFPVKTYYERIGFDFSSEQWETVAMEFMNNYWGNMDSVPLFDDALSLLTWFSKANIRQFIVSAMEDAKLKGMVKERHLNGFFERVYGIDNHYAQSKAHLGQLVLEKSGLNPKEVLWIGDTYHDFEVAGSLGIETVLVVRGHQNREALARADCSLYESLSELINT